MSPKLCKLLCMSEKEKSVSSNKNIILKYSLILLVVVVILLVPKAVNKLSDLRGLNDNNEAQENKNLEDFSEELSDWKEVEEIGFGFSYGVPPLLIRNEPDQLEDYLQFVRYEENFYATAKGVAIGISQRSIEDEVNKVITDIKEESEIEPSEILDIQISDSPAKKIVYSLQDEKDKESEFIDKEIIVFNNDKFTISISSSREQMRLLVGTIKYL